MTILKMRPYMWSTKEDAIKDIMEIADCMKDEGLPYPQSLEEISQYASKRIKFNDERDLK